MKLELDKIADVQGELRRFGKECPNAMKFLESYCGFYTAAQSSDPYEISYSGGKRDVILTIKTIMRDDLLPEQIAQLLRRSTDV
jgi:hypothetical protein